MLQLTCGLANALHLYQPASQPARACYLLLDACRGLKRLCRAPQLSALLLDGCDHVTEYGIECIINSGSIRVLVVQGCGGVDER